MKKSYTIAALVVTLLMVTMVTAVSPASALQSGSLNPSLSSNFGSVSLSPGFLPDPYTVSIESGGDVNASAVGCAGFVTSAPDFELFLTDASSQLGIFFVGDGDTTLIINDPNGQWYCNDDYSGVHPMVGLSSAPGGVYDIWVGSYNAGSYIGGTLYITEMGYSPANYAASNNGGEISVGDINSGGNNGNAISVGDTTGGGQFDYAVICIVNDTNNTVNYSYRWGNNSWSETSVSAGSRRYHSIEMVFYLNEVLDPNADHQPDFEIQFDELLSNDDYFKEYTLLRAAGSGDNCDQGYEYTFQYVTNSRIDLYDTN